MPHVVLFHSGSFWLYVHVANEMLVFVSLECSLSWNSIIDVSINTSSFSVYALVVLSDIGTV